MINEHNESLRVDKPLANAIAVSSVGIVAAHDVAIVRAVAAAVAASASVADEFSEYLHRI